MFNFTVLKISKYTLLLIGNRQFPNATRPPLPVMSQTRPLSKPGSNGPLLPPAVSTPGSTTGTSVLPMSSQIGGQIGASHITPVSGTSVPQGSQTNHSLAGQVKYRG